MSIIESMNERFGENGIIVINPESEDPTIQEHLQGDPADDITVDAFTLRIKGLASDETHTITHKIGSGPFEGQYLATFYVGRGFEAIAPSDKVEEIT